MRILGYRETKNLDQPMAFLLNHMIVSVVTRMPTKHRCGEYYTPKLAQLSVGDAIRRAAAPLSEMIGHILRYENHVCFYIQILCMRDGLERSVYGLWLQEARTYRHAISYIQDHYT